MKLERYEGNPILAPHPGRKWEQACATNPGAWYDGRTVHLLYRAGPDNDAHPVYFGLARSRDGFRFKRTSTRPVFGPSADGFDAGCVEDARIVKFDGTYAVVYAARAFPPGAYWRKTIPLNAHNPPLPPEAPAAARENLTRSGLALTRDFITWHRLGPITDATVDNRDAILFPERIGRSFALLHRPASWIGPTHGCDRPSMWISFSEDLLAWNSHHLLASPAYTWEARKIGGSTPPIKTPRGWLCLYHGVDEKQVYRVGAMLLDVRDPRRILARTPEPILEPETPYEREGLVPNVVFPTGNVVIGERLFVYYGGADKVCCVATIKLKELVGHLLKHPWRPAARRGGGPGAKRRAGQST
ncbi:MAG TPA: glycosidase [Kiritimatiellia bacterium]|mgnify:CR=1 FL=1|nr:glycosidase [Kiritimatiellia bacterium]